MAQEAKDIGRPLQGRSPAEWADERESTRGRRVYRPEIDIYETKNGIVLVANMPGVAKDGLDITIDKGVLTLRGLRETKPVEGYREAYAEYAAGDYERVFTLSEDIDVDEARATLANGVLTLRLPKAGPAKARRIEVAAS